MQINSLALYLIKYNTVKLETLAMIRSRICAFTDFVRVFVSIGLSQRSLSS